MGDIFDMLSGGGRRQQQRERRGENVVHRLKASLEEMYSGAVRKLSLSRNIKCDTCGGSGTKSGKRYQCDVGHLTSLIFPCCCKLCSRCIVARRPGFDSMAGDLIGCIECTLLLLTCSACPRHGTRRHYSYWICSAHSISSAVVKTCHSTGPCHSSSAIK